MGHKYDWASIPSYIPKVMKAFPLTIEILLLSLLFSLIIGALVAVGALSKNKVARAVTKGWISFMRGIPTLVLIFLLYLGLPQLMNALGVNMSGISKTTYIVACLALSTSANMAEMMRAAYLSVNKGQREAAYSVEMKPFTAFRRIVFPQALGVAIPTLGNNIIMLFKETSLAFTIGVIDILGRARALSSASYGTNRLEIYIATGLIFWAVCFILEKLTKLVEIMYTKGRKQAAS